MNIDEMGRALAAGSAVLACRLALRGRRPAARRTRALLGRPARIRPLRWVRSAAAAAAGRRPAWAVPELLLLPVGLAVSRTTESVVPLLMAVAAVVPLRRWRLRRRRAATAGRRTAAVIDLCAGLVAELRSGATPEYALRTVIDRSMTLRQDLGREPSARLAAVRYGADVPAAFHLIAELPGGRGAGAVAACWQISADSGTGLALGLDRIADALRAERALSEEVAGELAGARTTVALLAALPVFGLALGTALGARPLPVLLHTPTGLACLTTGVLLEAAGLAWTARIVRAAEDAPDAGTGRRTRQQERTADLPGAGVDCGLSRTKPARAGRRSAAAWHPHHPTGAEAVR
ncbi:type II secretion system F family protein [Kitasatospora sp. NPDC059571]|uniref:type II secretion system F family protein n=1 Tax=Kitasatospora sp. NPDC059571 TaxID=3346871 RepID=UPI0036A4E74E